MQSLLKLLTGGMNVQQICSSSILDACQRRKLHSEEIMGVSREYHKETAAMLVTGSEIRVKQDGITKQMKGK